MNSLFSLGLINIEDTLWIYGYIEYEYLVAVLRDMHNIQGGWNIALNRLQKLGEPGTLVAESHSHHGVDRCIDAFI